MIPAGIITPKRVLHVTTNAVTHPKTAITTNLDEFLVEYLLVWLDDLFLLAPDVPRLLEGIQRVLKFRRKLDFKLRPEKYILYSATINWCGRQFSEKRI